MEKEIFRNHENITCLERTWKRNKDVPFVSKSARESWFAKLGQNYAKYFASLLEQTRLAAALMMRFGKYFVNFGGKLGLFSTGDL